MLQIKQSQATAALRRIPVRLLDDADGKTPKTGITMVAGDIKISKNGAVETNHGGTFVEIAGGNYYYEAAVGECDTLGFWLGRFVKPTCRTFAAEVQIVAFDPNATPATVPPNFSVMTITPTTGLVTTTNPGGLDATATRAALGMSSPNLDTQLGAINAKTVNLPPAPSAVGSVMKVESGTGANQIQLSAGLVTSTNAGVGLDAPQTRAALGMTSPNLDTQLSGINSKTINLPASPAAVGSIMKVESGTGANQMLLSGGMVTTSNPGTGLDATQTRAALGLATPNLDTQLSGISSKTVNLPPLPSAVGSVMKVESGTGANQIQLTAGLVTSTNAGSGLDAAATRAALGMSSPNLDTQLTGISSKTTNLPASPAAVGSLMKVESGTGANQILTSAGLVTSTNAGTGLDAAGTRSALGLASPNLDTQLGAINSKTTNLPPLPSAVGSIMKVESGSGPNQVLLSSGLVTSTNAGTGLDAAGTRSALGMSAPNLDTQLAGISSKTVNLPAQPSAVGSIMKLETGAGANQILLTSGQVTSTNAGSGLDASGTRAALGLASPNLDAQLSVLPTIVNRIGAWVGTGANTILGGIRALASKAAATVSDIGGTFSSATDSLEAIVDNGAGGGGLDANGIRTALGMAAPNLDAQLDALPTNAETITLIANSDDAMLAALQAYPLKRNTAGQKVYILMMTPGGVGKTGIPTITKTLDGGASWLPVTGTVTEIGDGGSWFFPSMADMNGEAITYKGVLTGAVDRHVTFYTHA